MKPRKLRKLSEAKRAAIARKRRQFIAGPLPDDVRDPGLPAVTFAGCGWARIGS